MEKKELKLEELRLEKQKILTNPSVIQDRRTNYYYYTKESTAKSILKPNKEGNDEICFWISSLEEMNDTQEAELHGKDSDHIYALCFSNTDSESIPMWYLYSGITGKGIRIGITPKKMMNLIENISQVYPVIDHRVHKDRPWNRGEHFEMQYGWVYYLGHKKLIYDNETYARASYKSEELNNDKDYLAFIEDNYFIKEYEWNYEREFRIVFNVNKEKVLGEHSEMPKQIALYCDKKQLLGKGGGLSVTTAPEMKEPDETALAEAFGLPEQKIKESQLKISMNLIKRNKDSFISSFEEILKETEKESGGKGTIAEMKRIISAYMNQG